MEKGVKEYFINWKCYSEKFNSWIKETEMTNTISEVVQLVCFFQVIEVIGERLPHENVERKDSRSGKWDVCGHDMSRSKAVFSSQVIIIYIVVCLCLFILTTNCGVSNFGTLCSAVVLVTYFFIQLSNDEFVLSHVTEQQLHGFSSEQHVGNLYHKIATTF